MRRIITEEVAKFINLARTEQRIPLKTLANCIGRSTAYLSNVENAKIRTISDLDLERILDCIIGTNESLRFFTTKKTDTIAFISKNNVNENLTLIFDYDLNVRRIEVPEKLISFIDVAMKMTKTSKELLYHEIEKFRSPPKNWKQENPPQANQAFCFNESVSVIVDFDFDYLEGVLTSKIKKTSYIVMASIILAHRIIMARNAGIMQEENEEELTDELANDVHSTLYEYGFLSIIQIAYMQSSANKNTEEVDDFALERNITDILRQINNYFRLYLESDADEKTIELSNLLKNLQWDTSFWVKVATLPYHRLEKASFTHKKSFIYEMKDVLDDYIESPEEIKNRDIY